MGIFLICFIIRFDFTLSCHCLVDLGQEVFWIRLVLSMSLSERLATGKSLGFTIGYSFTCRRKPVMLTIRATSDTER